ncbi:MAG TPA: TetR/AcrR family transcriptional regulator [Candidatus Blautia excrementipullorum]|nr:TetR/AcrR family transcriptional regulator [Candidatus Blautia excrementipullorum]
MDIRIEKTENAIKNAFLEIRARKPLEKITVKELCACAQINKSTFYAHYQDIYALSEKLEQEIVNSILKTMVSRQKYSVKNSDIFVRDLYMACLANSSLINIVFSGKNQSRLADCLEKEVKALIWKKYPQYREDIEKNIMLSYGIYGTFYVYLNNQNVDPEILIRVSEKIVKRLSPLYDQEAEE